MQNMNDKYVCIYIYNQCIYLYAHSLITHGKPIRLSLVIHTPRDRHEGAHATTNNM